MFAQRVYCSTRLSLPISGQFRQFATKTKHHPPRRTFLHNKYQDIILNNRAIFIFQHNNLSVQEFTRLRQEMSVVEDPCKLTVIRSGIFASILRETKYRNLEPLLNGPTCTLTMDTENPESLKKAIDILSRNKKLLLLGGKLDNMLLTQQDAQKIIELPSIDLLRAQVLGVIEAPVRKLLSTLESPAAQVHSILDRRI